VKSYVLCCVSQTKISEDFLKDVKDYLSTASANITGSERYLEQGFRALDLHLDFPHEFETIKFHLMDLSNKHQVDMALIPLDGKRSDKKLIVFDMDSTLIQHEVIVEMARVHGVGDKVQEITERAMNGELNFDQALRERIALLKGLKREDMEKIQSHLKLSPGVERLILELRKHGYKTAIISGGFQFFADNFKNRLHMDYAFANTLDFENNALSGKVTGTIINASEKARLVEVLAQKENISLDQVVAVGDGANDLPMLAKAGFGIAWHAKETVRKQARHLVHHSPMTTILYFLGIPGNHLDEIV
jgi:phosphoserine phosphatase